MAQVGAGPEQSQAERSIISRSPAATLALGADLGRLLAPGDFVGLVGELGTGKTHFVRGVAEGAGIDRARVSSPSFAIISAYRGRLNLYHADLFRLRDYDEVYATGFTDLPGDGAMLVEWLDRVPRAAPREMMLVLFENLGGQRRRLSARAVGARYCALLEQWISRRAAAARRSRQRARS
jgi:tRNA threonylcarbamoyladenosine biosynthesis protein TsaE